MSDTVPMDRDGPIPYLMTGSAREAIDFCTAALGATELYRLPMPDGAIGHAELQVGGGVVCLADVASGPDQRLADPGELGRTTISLSLA